MAFVVWNRLPSYFCSLWSKMVGIFTGIWPSFSSVKNHSPGMLDIHFYREHVAFSLVPMSLPYSPFLAWAHKPMTFPASSIESADVRGLAPGVWQRKPTLNVKVGIILRLCPRKLWDLWFAVPRHLWGLWQDRKVLSNGKATLQKLSETSEEETAQSSVTIFPFKTCGRIFAVGILPTAGGIARGRESLYIRERRETKQKCVELLNYFCSWSSEQARRKGWGETGICEMKRLLNIKVYGLVFRHAHPQIDK